jgi:uncharacterized membrane protein (UPF0127 family)
MTRLLTAVAALAVLAAAAIAVVALAGDDGDSSPRARGALVTIGSATVRAEVAADDASRRRGLAGRDGLAADRGMLFLLPHRRQSFWMQGMRFPIDIVWIDAGRVVDVTADVPPPRAPGAALPTYSPDRPAGRVLEVNAGWAARHGVRVGDAVRVRPGGSG